MARKEKEDGVQQKWPGYATAGRLPSLPPPHNGVATKLLMLSRFEVPFYTDIAMCLYEKLTENCMTGSRKYYEHP